MVARRQTGVSGQWSVVSALFFLLCGGPVRGDDSLAERRQRIEDMKPAEQEQLLRKQERWESLAPAERERLLRLHEEVTNNPEAAQVMRRYCEWLSTLPAARRETLLELEPKDRIKRIKELREEEAKANARRPDPGDVERLVRWMDEYAAKQEDRFVKKLPEDRRQPWAKLDARKRHDRIKWFIWLGWQIPGPGKLPTMSDEDLKDVRARLSPDTQKRLEALPPAEQWRTFAGWLRRSPPIDEEHLADFFERELTNEERDDLMSRPPDEMQKELRKLYLAKYKLIEPPVRPPDGRWRGKGPRPPGAEGPFPKKPERGPAIPDNGPRPKAPPPGPPTESPTDAP